MSTADPVRKHRREVRNRIILPVALAFVALIALNVVLIAAVASGAMVSKQITTVMSVVATVFIALPMMLLCLIPVAALVLSAWGVGRIHGTARGPLGTVRRLTGQVAVKTNEFAPRLARPTTAVNIRLTRWEYTLRGWLMPAVPAEEDLSDE
jgi:ABC-type dipeptide/oligopeptide/nickel transport system permease subunit